MRRYSSAYSIDNELYFRSPTPLPDSPPPPPPSQPFKARCQVWPAACVVACCWTECPNSSAYFCERVLIPPHLVRLGIATCPRLDARLRKLSILSPLSILRESTTVTTPWFVLHRRRLPFRRTVCRRCYRSSIKFPKPQISWKRFFSATTSVDCSGVYSRVFGRKR